MSQILPLFLESVDRLQDNRLVGCQVTVFREKDPGASDVLSRDLVDRRAIRADELYCRSHARAAQGRHKFCRHEVGTPGIAVLDDYAHDS